MANFSISPVGPFTPDTDEGFPQFLQWQADGLNLGGPDAGTVNIADGLIATRGEGENADVITIAAVPPTPPGVLAWRYVEGDDAVLPSDVMNGIVFLAETGSPTLAINSGVIEIGESVLVVQKGAASVTFSPASGVDLVFRSGAFSATSGGQGSIVTLIALSETEIIICGDLGPVAV